MPRRTKKTDAEEFPLLGGLGLKIIAIDGDGNCLFSSFSEQLYGTTDKHAEIRANVVEYMRTNPAEFKPFISYDGERRGFKRTANKSRGSSAVSTKNSSEAKIDAAWEKYLKSMAKLRNWGDHLAIRAFACAYKRNVRVHRTDGDHDVTSNDVGNPIAYIAYHSWRHYSSVRRIDGGIPAINFSISEQSKIEHWMANSLTSPLPFDAKDHAVKPVFDTISGTTNTLVDHVFNDSSSYSNSAPTSPDTSFTSISDSESDGSLRSQISGRQILTPRKRAAVRLDVDHSATSSPFAFSQCGTSTFNVDEDGPVHDPVHRKRKSSVATDIQDIPHLDLDNPSISAPDFALSHSLGSSSNIDDEEFFRGSKRPRHAI